MVYGVRGELERLLDLVHRDVVVSVVLELFVDDRGGSDKQRAERTEDFTEGEKCGCGETRHVQWGLSGINLWHYFAEEE